MSVCRDPQWLLTSDRLGFRAWREDDVELAVALWSDPDVARFITTESPSRATSEARLASELAGQRAHGMSYWPMFLLEGGAFVGCCGLRPYQIDDGILEIGVHVRPAFWRRGLAVEAARAVIAHAFDTLGARALFAGHNPANAASRQMLSRLGFRYTHDELYPPTGLMHPSYLLER